MSSASDNRSEEFLKISGQFKLGALITESSHPVTANLSEIARRDVAAALDLLFQVDADVLSKYREFAESGRAGEIADALLRSLRNGGKIFFTGCGSTGRLSILLVSIWRDFWQRQRECRPAGLHPVEDWEDRAFSVMAGGDYALIKSVEGFEDFAAFGRKQLGDLGVCNKDVVFAITEGGETSFVIGTAWQGVEAGAKVYFVYNNPDEILCRHVERSREVIEDPRIEKINLTTGPMAISGSTRMQATSIQLCVLLTVLEMVVRESRAGILPASPAVQRTEDKSAVDNSAGGDRQDACPTLTATVPAEFLAALAKMHATLSAPSVLEQIAKLVALEESVYRAGRRTNYFADHFGIDVLTDTTERSPTYCTPPFRKFDDARATESWAFLFLPCGETAEAWERILKRRPHCVEWSSEEVRALVGEMIFARTNEIVRKISSSELMRFRIGLDGLRYRPAGAGDCVVGIWSERERDRSRMDPFLEAISAPGVRAGFVYFGSREKFEELSRLVAQRNPECVPVFIPVAADEIRLDGVTRVGVKLVLNALSTCTMVRLGRVMGNTMVWVVPSNLKLIDRSTRYIARLTGLTYEAANRLLFEVIEYIEPRMKADQAYPPAVGLAVLRARHKVTCKEAERRLAAESAGS